MSLKDVSGFRDVAMVGTGNHTYLTTDANSESQAESQADLKTESRAESFADCALEKQLSSHECVEGKSFGCYGNNQSMWTSGGCRGMFTCDGQKSVPCDVMGGDFSICKCVTGPVSGFIYLPVFHARVDTRE